MAWAPIPDVWVVGITGHARHGKDELARALVRQIPGAERFAFSDAVSAVARTLHLMGPREAHVLQALGTRVRQADPETWLRCLYHAIADKRPRVAVLTGLRYPNELALVRDMGGTLVAVERPHAPALTDRDPAHPVEQQIASLVAQAETVLQVNEFRDAEALEAAFDRMAADLVEQWTVPWCCQ